MQTLILALFFVFVALAKIHLVIDKIDIDIVEYNVIDEFPETFADPLRIYRKAIF